MAVQSTISLLGRADWWPPRWLDRVLPRVDVEDRGPAPETGERPRELISA